MRTFDLIFDGVNEIRMNITHKFFLLLTDGGSAIDISVRKNSGFQKVSGVQAGFGIKLTSETMGREFIFTSSVAQTVKIFVGDDEAIYNRLSGTVTLNGGALTSLGSITNTVKTVDDGTVSDNWFKAINNLAAGGVDTAVAPGVNTNGILLQDAELFSYSSTGFCQVTLLAKSSAPTSLTDGDILLSFYANSSTSVPVSRLVKSVRVAAGKGLYFFNGNSQAETISLRKLNFDLL